MTFFIATRIALHAIARNKLRSALTALGIIIGVGSLIALLGVGHGVRIGHSPSCDHRVRRHLVIHERHQFFNQGSECLIIKMFPQQLCCFYRIIHRDRQCAHGSLEHTIETRILVGRNIYLVKIEQFLIWEIR